MCGVSVSTFNAHVRPHLREIRIGARPMFVESDVESWVRKQAGGRSEDEVPGESGRFAIASKVRKASDPLAREIEKRLLQRALASTPRK